MANQFERNHDANRVEPGPAPCSQQVAKLLVTGD